MPTYVYRCAKCGEQIEAFQTFADAPLTKHTDCGGKLTKVLSAAGIVLKGSGFYKTDNRSGSNGGHKERQKESTQKESTQKESTSSSSGSSGSDSSSSGSGSSGNGSSKSSDGSSSSSSDSGSGSSGSGSSGSSSGSEAKSA
jgi:putative FmdB family regulatory protein